MPGASSVARGGIIVLGALSLVLVGSAALSRSLERTSSLGAQTGANGVEDAVDEGGVPMAEPPGGGDAAGSDAAPSACAAQASEHWRCVDECNTRFGSGQKQEECVWSCPELCERQCLPREEIAACMDACTAAHEGCVAACDGPGDSGCIASCADALFYCAVDCGESCRDPEGDGAGEEPPAPDAAALTPAIPDLSLLTPDELLAALATGASPACGDGALDATEECDDANARSYDGCNGACFFEAGACGDGVIQRALGEQCEPASHDPALPYDCNPATCRFLSRTCGNGAVEPGETCDNGLNNSDEPAVVACRGDCSQARCGDGIRDLGETCDDANYLDGDGCSLRCQSETAAAEEDVAVPASISPASPSMVSGHSADADADVATAAPVYGSVRAMAPRQPFIAETGPAAALLMASAAGVGFALARRRR